MDGFAAFPGPERAVVFTETAAFMGIRPVIVEKDFWVCWVLKRIFELSSDRPGMIFKGGTSLSKAYGLIDRFSEDVDLSLDRASFYRGELGDPEKAPSKKKAQALIDALADAAGVYVSVRLLPELEADLATVLGDAGESWSLEVDADDALTIIFRYPTSLDAARYDEFRYLRPIVQIEMGIRSDQWPASFMPVKPYAADHVPGIFREPSADVRVLAAERTFWEKVTLLHAEYHRPSQSPAKENLSRHYYDVVRIARSHVKTEALRRIDLLERVVAHKNLFFPSGWAHYDTAMPGGVRLVPTNPGLDQLRTDYGNMREMIFGDAPTFDEVVAALEVLEIEINGLAAAPPIA